LKSAADTAPRIEVAGTVFEVSGLDAAGSAWVEERYAGFLSDRAPQVRLTTARVDEDVDEDGGELDVETRGDHLRLALGGYRIEGDLRDGRLRLTAPPFPSVLSPATFRGLCAILLLRAGGVMLHASAVVDRGRAWVFCGASESGKTTVARLAAPRGVLSDETVALRPDGGRYLACATPFFGEAGPVPMQTHGTVPLAAVFFLAKSPRFAHRRLGQREAVQRAFPQVFVPKRDPARAEAILAALATLTAAVPCYELEFAASEELWSYVDAVA
jgi:hypothetical protein